MVKYPSRQSFMFVFIYKNSSLYATYLFVFLKIAGNLLGHDVLTSRIIVNIVFVKERTLSYENKQKPKLALETAF